MDILCLTRNYKGFVGLGEKYYLDELARRANVEFFGPGYDNYKGYENKVIPLPEVMEKIYGSHEPDLIYYSQCSTEPIGRLRGVSATRPPKVAWMHNGHNYRDQQVARIHGFDTKLALFRSWTSFYFEYMRRLNCRMLFHPQSVDTNIFKDYGHRKDYDVVFTGVVTPYYSLREKMQRRLHAMRDSGELRVATPEHWGYQYNTDEIYEERLKPRGCVWGRDYAELLNRGLVLPTDGGRFNVPVRKYLEAPACRTLLLAPAPYMHWMYGFVPDVNFVSVTAENWEARLFEVLEDKERLRRVTDEGWKHIRRYHSTEKRVGELLEIFSLLLSGEIE